VPPTCEKPFGKVAGNGIKLFAYIGRRIAVVLVILFGSSFLVYNLEAVAGDPLADLRTSTATNKAFLIAQLTRQLQLDVPPPIRYFIWLKGVLASFLGTPDFGKTRQGIPVLTEIATAVPITIRLVLGATILAILLGITVGVITAIRQYSRLDYIMTFISFLMFSLPIFWVAVLLKQYLAIDFNNFLASGQIPVGQLLITAAVIGVVLAGVISGSRKRVLTVWGIGFAGTIILLLLVNATNWIIKPGIGIVGVGLIGLAVATGFTALIVGFENKRVLYAAISVAALGIVGYFPVMAFWKPGTINIGSVLLVFVILGFLAVVAAYAFTKVDRGPAVRVTLLTSVFVSFFLLVDKLMQVWNDYLNADGINMRPIPTIGEASVRLSSDDFWINTMDGLVHVFLPTIALTLISFAGYVRYSRGSLLEVMNMDYIRTARAKGLSERTVIVRHALRNAMIPLTTLMAFDFAGVIGGAIITERVFGWHGMGTLFNQAIGSQDLNLLMGVFAITSFMAVMANLAADLIYGALDPRIRVGK
jgi:peptide/nickel transport system permease protein